MIETNLENQLSGWQKILFVHIGASATLFATAIADIPNDHEIGFPGWYSVWFLLQIATIMPAVLLMMGREWRRLPFHFRINTIFSYLGVGWTTLLSLGVKLVSDFQGSFFLLAVFLPIIGCSVIVLYWLLRKRYLSPESFFP